MRRYISRAHLSPDFQHRRLLVRFDGRKLLSDTIPRPALKRPPRSSRDLTCIVQLALWHEFVRYVAKGYLQGRGE